MPLRGKHALYLCIKAERLALRLQYAQWEEAQKDFRRARSVWERALDVNPQSITLWLRYAEMEMRGRFVNHARNVWDRAVQVCAGMLVNLLASRS